MHYRLKSIQHVTMLRLIGKVEGSDICPKPSSCEPGHDPIGNRLYGYELVNLPRMLRHM